MAGDGTLNDNKGPKLFSLLHPDRPGAPSSGTAGSLAPPEYLADLNLDQMIAELAEGEDAALATVFSSPLRDAEAVRYRQEIFRDLEVPALRRAAQEFREMLREARRHLSALDKRLDPRQRQAWFLEAALVYCQGVAALEAQLRSATLASSGMKRLSKVLSQYLQGAAFAELQREALELAEALAQLRYCVRVRGMTVEVSRYNGQRDFSREIAETFERFRQGKAKDYRVAYRTPPHLGQVGERILEQVSRLFPDEFAKLEDFCLRHERFYSEQLSRTDFELGFYLSYLDYIEPVRRTGLRLCYPEVAERSSEIMAEDAFDLVLARKLAAEGKPVVVNPIELLGEERIFVVSGPNQGGKTTFARTVGQLHHLGAIGCPIPASKAKLGLFDEIFTHFQSEERPSDLRGRLENDLLRMRAILERATEASIVIMNETFSSTTLDDARFLGRRIMEKLIALGVRGVFVTFVEELASMGPQVVSLVSEVLPEDPARRTFRIRRAPPDGLAYAMAIAAKHGVTYERLREVLGQ